MKCVLHVGTEKTATTTLQHLFDRNRGWLLNNGVAYTRAAGETNNWRLAVAAYDDDRHDDRSIDAGLSDAASRSQFSRRLVADLGAELQEAAELGAERVLFSSEHLHARLATSSELHRLAGLLERLGVTETVVVVYLRDPVAVAASLHSTRVKHGATARHPPPPEASYYRNVCDHRNTIERWGAFGTVVPRLFEPDALVDGSVVADMLDVLGLTADADWMADHQRPRNRSLSRAGIEVLSRINEQVPYAVNGVLNPVHRGLVEAFERHSSGDPYQLPALRAEQYREAFAASNEWVRQRFFPQRRHLFPSEDPTGEDGPNPIGFDGLASLILELSSASAAAEW